MSQQFGVFEEIKKYTPDIRLSCQNFSIMAKYHKSISIQEPEMYLPFSKGLSFVVFLSNDVHNSDNVSLSFVFENNGDQIERIKFTAHVFNADSRCTGD